MQVRREGSTDSRREETRSFPNIFWRADDEPANYKYC